MKTAIVELLPREDALHLALTCWPLRDVALSIIHREISLSTTGSSTNYKLGLLRDPNIQKRVRTLNLKLSASTHNYQDWFDLAIWVLATLEFPILKNFILATSRTPSILWHNLFVFLYRHPSLQAVKLDFHGCPQYQNYDHTRDPGKLWTYITPRLLPSLQALTVDAAFLAALARARVFSLRQLEALHIVDYCIGDQDAIWLNIRGAADLLHDLPVLVFTYLPTATPPAFVEIAEHLPFAFSGVRHLSTNFGEGQWSAVSFPYTRYDEPYSPIPISPQEGFMDLLHEFTIIWTLSIPVRVAQDFLSDTDLDEMQTATTEQALLIPMCTNSNAYTCEADLAFRHTAEVQKITAEMTKELQEMSPVQQIILHVPGWLPGMLAF